MRNKTKKTLKGIGLGALAVATLIGGVAAINHFTNRADEDGLVKVHLNYDIGGLDSNGEYEETEESIYTKNAFESQGLKVEVDFDSTIDYELFFYDQYGDFISSTGKLEKNFDGELPFNATHTRIEITPQEDEDGIKWYEKNGYASQLTIKVDENQKLEYLHQMDGQIVVDSMFHNKLYNETGIVDNTLGYDVDTSTTIDVKEKKSMTIAMKEVEESILILIKDIPSSNIVVEENMESINLASDLVLNDDGYYTYTFELDNVNNVKILTSSSMIASGIYYDLV